MNTVIYALLVHSMSDLYEKMEIFTLIIHDTRHDQMGTIMTQLLLHVSSDILYARSDMGVPAQNVQNATQMTYMY